MRVGDLVRILSDDSIGVVFKIHDARHGPPFFKDAEGVSLGYPPDVEVLCADGVQEWEEDELEVISESG